MNSPTGNIVIISALMEELTFIHNDKRLTWSPCNDLPSELMAREARHGEYTVISIHANDNREKGTNLFSLKNQPAKIAEL